MPVQTSLLIQTASIMFDITPDGVMIRVNTPDGAACAGPIKDTSANFWKQTHTASYVRRDAEPKLKKVSAKRNKRRSMAQETEIMEELGGRRQAGSGARSHLKGDGRVRDKYRVEIKFTRKGSYRITRDELGKIRGECTGMEQPLFVIGFKDPETGGNEDRWVMMPFHQFQKMDKAAGTKT